MTPSNTIEELVGRVEAATGPNEQIDCLVWQIASPDQRVMFDGGKAFGPGPKRPATYGRLADFPLDNWTDWHAIRMLIDAPPVTASIDAAIALAERVLPGWYWRAGRMTAPKWERGEYQPYWAHIQRTHADHCDREDESTGYAKSAPLAIILATLRSLRIKGDHNDEASATGKLEG